MVVLVILGAAAAALGFQRLGSNIGTVLVENFESVRSSMRMLDALERQDSAVLAVLLEKEGAWDLLASSEAAFQTAVRAARTNVTIAQEIPVLDEIEGRYAEYQRARDDLLTQAWERPLLEYENETFPRFVAVKEKVFELLDLNHQAMIDADRSAQQAARLRAAGHGLLVLVALVTLAAVSRAMSRELLDRLADLSSVARAMALGDRSRRLTPLRDNELGAVARQLNVVLDRLAETESSTAGRFRQERQLVLALLAELSEPAALVSLAGELMATTLTPEGNELVERAARRLSDTVDRGANREVSVEVEGHSLTFRPLSASGVRPLVWLVTGLTDAFSAPGYSVPHSQPSAEPGS